MRASRGLKWENETYKLKRSISDTRVQFYKFIVTALAIEHIRILSIGLELACNGG